MKQTSKQTETKSNVTNGNHSTLRERARAFEYADVRALLLEQNRKDGGVRATHLPTR